MKFPSLPWKVWAFLFVLYSTIIAAIIIHILPPFTAADELNHFRRANMLLYGEILGKRERFGDKVVAGGTCEKNLIKAWKCFEPVPAHFDVKPGAASWSHARTLRWGAQTTPAGFENTAIYPPTYYLPQSAAIGVGKAIDLTILSTLTLARIANAIACVLLGLVALRTAQCCRAYLFTLLLLPMSVDLMATSTQDGLLITSAALAGALLANAIGSDRPLSKWETIVVAVCFAAIGMAKAPYGLLAFLLLLVRTEKPRWRTIALVSSLTAVFAWTAIDTAYVQTPMMRSDAIVDAHAQTLFVLGHPFVFLVATARTIFHQAVSFGVQMIASLGSMDTPMPKMYFILAIAAIASSFAILFMQRGEIDRRKATIALGLMAATALGVFGALYITFTGLRSPVVEGVQGRYFLPIAAFLPVVFARRVRPDDQEEERQGWSRRLLTLFVLGFPAISAIIVERALTARYY